MKIKSSEKAGKNKKNLNSNLSPSKRLISEEEKDLTANEINALIEKYKHVKQKPTIIGEEPYEPFLAGITEDNWKSVGDEFKDE